MKKILFLFVLSVSFAMTAKAAVPAPVDAQGHALTTSDWTGAIPCIINGANQPAAPTTVSPPIVCGSSSTAARYMVYGVIASSITQTAYLVFRDTIPAGAGGLLGVQSSTVAVVYNYDVEQSSGTGPGTHLIKFPVPIQFLKGIAVNTDSTFGGALASWTILYRPMNATE